MPVFFNTYYPKSDEFFEGECPYCGIIITVPAYVLIFCCPDCKKIMKNSDMITYLKKEVHISIPYDSLDIFKYNKYNIFKSNIDTMESYEGECPHCGTYIIMFPFMFIFCCPVCKKFMYNIVAISLLKKKIATFIENIELII